MTLALHYALRSDVGLLREGNEDSAYAGPSLLAIADGMGGHAAGEVASAVAISAIAPLDHQNLHESQAMLGALANAVATANTTLHEMSIADPSTEGMGTTLTALLWAGSQVALCHIGDSRAYLLRDGDFYQISRDHTLVQSLVDEGRLTPAAAATHPQRSLVMRALQSSTDAEPDLVMREAILGDRYLLCSDGLSDVVTDQTIHKTLVSSTDPAQAVDQLINLALHGGGPDNITCIVADVVDTVSGPVPPSQGTVLAGAAANGDGRPHSREDSPAGRASLLTQARPVPQQAPARPAGQPADGRHRAPGPSYDDDEAEADPGRRRWPVVTTILVILILLVAGGGYTAWRITQGQYYVGTDGQQVIIYRGINQKVAGLNLSSTFQRTGIPVSHVQSSVLELPTASGSLPEAQRTVTNIRQTYTCTQATQAVQKWLAGKPKPPVIAKGHKPTKQQRQQEAKVKAYPPKPKVPASCPSQGAG
ncbi:MAG TPA: protein phosphatase 2C domain-containing protein [Streptosporangiaceae bacterium]|jgi:protein phosphatase